MSATPTTTWAVLPGGNAANGGGFDNTVVAPGTDFSQQNAPQFTYTDLVIGAANTVTSAGHPFDSTCPGNYIHVTSGTGFTVGWYRVNSVAGAVATLNSSPGTLASTGGNGKLGGAFAKPDDVNTPVGSIGGKVWCVGTTFTIGGTGIAVTATGADQAPLSFIGNGTSRNDGTPAVFTCNAADPGIAMDFQGQLTIVRGFKLVGAGIPTTGININQIWSSISNCWVTGVQRVGIKLNNFNLKAFRCRVSGCTAGTTAGGAFFGSGGCSFIQCEADGNIANGFGANNQPYEVIRCAAWNNTLSGFYTQGAGALWATQCESYGNTLDGARWDATNSINNSFLINCVFANNGGYGLRSITTDYSVSTMADVGLTRFHKNAFWNNALGNYFQMPTGNGDIICSVDPTTGVDNFAPNTAAGGGQLIRGTGWSQIGTEDDPRPTVSANDVGVAQSVATGPNPPTLLTAAAAGPTVVNLSWVDNSSNEDNFAVERQIGAGAFVQIALVGTGGTVYQDATTTGATQYTYRVKAVNGAGSSTYSNSVVVVTPLNTGLATPPVIDEVQFPTDISEGAQGGPMFSTIVTSGSTGDEARVPMWRVGRYKFNIGYGLKSPAAMLAVLNFFICRNGKSRGFRFKDWSDFQTTNEVLTQTGAKTVQLQKTYTSGVVSYVRSIFKPQTGTTAVTLRRGGVNYATFTLDTTSGVVTLTADSTKAITGITQASSAVVTATAHGFSVGDFIYFENVGGMTVINGVVAKITATTTNTFTILLDTTGFAAYSSSGSAEKYIQPSEVLDWSGEFDIPMRFDVDEMEMQQVASEVRDWQSIAVLELLN